MQYHVRVYLMEPGGSAAGALAAVEALLLKQGMCYGPAGLNEFEAESNDEWYYEEDMLDISAAFPTLLICVSGSDGESVSWRDWYQAGAVQEYPCPNVRLGPLTESGLLRS